MNTNLQNAFAGGDDTEFIDAKGISFAYRNQENMLIPVLENLDIKIAQGEFVAVLGHNGSGKSTMAKHFNAVLLPSEGICYVDKMNTADDSKLYDIRQTVGMVFQNPDNQIVAAVVEEDVAFGPENIGVPPGEIRTRVDEALAAVGMSEYSKHAPHLLSGGQKQRIAIAGIIAMRPRCIVLDEPTAMLDPKGRREVMKTIRLMNKHFGITIVLITHYMDEAAASDRVVVVDDGKIVLDDVPRAVFANVEQMRAMGLDVPQVTELAYLLRKDGFDLPEQITTEDECVQALTKLLQGVGK